MIQENLLRLKGLELGSPIISCGEGHRFMVAQQIGEVMGEMKTMKQVQGDGAPTIILEPMAKNTAPAIAAACCAAMKQDPWLYKKESEAKPADDNLNFVVNKNLCVPMV